MPRAATCDNARFIVGPGLDEVIEPNARLVILDEYYADMYGDYVFAGYNVLHTNVETSYADFVGAYTAAMLIDEGAIVVCGEDPLPCTVALAARKIFAGASWLQSLNSAWHCLSTLYPEKSGSVAVPAGLASALKAVERTARLLGVNGRLLVSLASNYEYGRGRRFYGELVTWLNNLSVEDEVFAAGLFSFLAESQHGKPWEILRYRLEAVGESNLLAAFGSLVEGALAILRRYAEGRLEDGSARLAYVSALGPGERRVLHVCLENGRPAIYCPTGGQGEPLRDCVEAVKRAAELAEKTGLAGWDKPRLYASEPEPLVVRA